MQIEEQSRILEELNYKITIKENQLGVSKEKEYIAKIKEMQKHIDALQKSIQEKDSPQTVPQPEILKEEKDGQTEDIKPILTPITQFTTLSYEKLAQFEYCSSKSSIIPDLVTTIVNNNDIIEGMTKEIEGLKKEKRKSEEKIEKMKIAIEGIQKRMDIELQKKEMKSIIINQTNSKLFDNITNKNNTLALELKKAVNRCILLAKEKYDIENIALKQETVIKQLEKKIELSILNKNNININYNNNNNNISGISSKNHIYSSQKHLLSSAHKLNPINANTNKKYHFRTNDENNQTLNLDESIH